MGPMGGPMGFFDEFLGFDGGRAEQKQMFDDFGADTGAASSMFFDMLAQPGPWRSIHDGNGTEWAWAWVWTHSVTHSVTQ